MFKAGLFFGPLLKLAENPESYDSEERSRLIARFCAEEDAFVHHQVMRFAEGEPGHNYAVERQRIYSLIQRIKHPLMNGQSVSPAWFESVKSSASEILEIITSIPIPIDSTIHEARTPFSTYCFVRDLCSTAKSGIVWMDRYFDHTIFHRYFTDMLPTVQVTLVTWPESKVQGAKDRERYGRFMDVSRLFASERGPDGYRLLTHDDFHDRWLRCDDKLFTLGGSIKDLASRSRSASWTSRRPTFSTSMTWSRRGPRCSGRAR
jgi:hypothetical protein